MKRSGLALLILILAAAIVLLLFTGRMKGSASSGEGAVRQAQDAVDAVNERLREAYTEG